MPEFAVGTLVWAKLTSYPFWPGRVTRIQDVKEKDVRDQLGPCPPSHVLIWFFGSKNYAWVAANQITAYDEGFEEKSKHKKAKTMKGFSQALVEAIAWKENPVEPDEDKSDKKPESSEKQTSPSKKQKTEDHEPKKEKKKEEESHKKREEKEKRREEKRKEKEERKKREREEREDDKKKSRDTEENVDKKREKKEHKKEEKRHSETSVRARDDTKEDDKSMRKRKAEEDEESHGHKKIKLEATPPKKTVPPSLEDKMETDSALVEGAEKALESDKPILQSAAVLKAILTLSRHPVSKYHKLDIFSYGKGYATARGFFSDARPGSKYEVHAVLGAAYFLLDVTAYAALLSLMHEGESAITQDIHVSVLAPIPQGSEVEVKAKLTKTKPKAGLMYLDGEVWHANKLMATAKVIKSLLEPDLPVKEVKDEKEPLTKKEEANNNVANSTTLTHPPPL